jgi:FkbM family methyltransferase
MEHLLRMKVQGFDPRVVVDVGAARGDWTKSCQRIFPDAHYIMVEPLPDYEEELAPLARQERIQYVKAAAGRAEATLPLLVPEHPGGSSFLLSSRPGDKYFKRTVSVPIVPLDSIDVPPGTTLIKLDVQGYELEVLAGARRLLGQVEVIIAECSLYPFQQDIPLIHETIHHVIDLDYRLYDVADEVRWRSGTLAQTDLIFVNARSQLLYTRWWD